MQLETLPGFPTIALAEASFARRSQSAGRFGNPPRVSITIGWRAVVQEPNVVCFPGLVGGTIVVNIAG
jgi:hypothetical protein